MVFLWIANPCSLGIDGSLSSEWWVSSKSVSGIPAFFSCPVHFSQNPGTLSKEDCSVAPVDVPLFGSSSYKRFIPKKPALLLSLPIRSPAHWFSNKHIQGKNIVSLIGRVIWSCPSRTVGLPPPDLAQGHTRALASLTGGSTIGPPSAQSPTSSFFPSQSEGNPTKAWFPFSAMVLGGNPV